MTLDVWLGVTLAAGCALLMGWHLCFRAFGLAVNAQSLWSVVIVGHVLAACVVGLILLLRVWIVSMIGSGSEVTVQGVVGVSITWLYLGICFGALVGKKRWKSRGARGVEADGRHCQGEGEEQS